MNENKIISSWDLQQQVKHKKPVKYYCGVKDIDEQFKGFEPGELITLSGPTKNGKSTCFQMLTTGFEKNHIYSLWFAYEVPPEQLIRRFKKLPLFYFPTVLKGRILEYLDDRIGDAVKQYKTRVIFIDHLHYLLDLAQAHNVSIQIGQIIRGLKQLAIKHRVVIFLAAHTKKLEADKEPSAESIRDSSFVGQESDAVMMIWRIKGVANESRLKLEYHRRIGIIDYIVKLIFYDNELRQKEW